MNQGQTAKDAVASSVCPSSRRTGRAGKAALVASSVFLTVAFCESLCRILGVGAAPATADYIADWDLHWGSDFYVLDPRYPAPGEHINSDGLRDRQRAIEKPAGTVRIACLGDSVTYGFLARPEESFPAQLESLLRERHVKSEVFNIALPGWTIRQQRIAYREIARKYQPDCVVLGICLNDIPEMQNNLLEPPGALLGALHRRSNLFRALTRSQEREIESVEELCRASSSPHVNRGWERYLAELEKFRSDIAADNIRLIAAILPFRFQVAAPTTLDSPQQRLRSFFTAAGTTCIDLLPTLQAQGTEAFLDYDHLSPQGSRTVAAVLMKAFSEENELNHAPHDVTN